jgi:hypothetical protein
VTNNWTDVFVQLEETMESKVMLDYVATVSAVLSLGLSSFMVVLRVLFMQCLNCLKLTD